jgi:hypothetical protein
MNDGLGFLVGSQPTVLYFVGLHAPPAHVSFHGFFFSLALSSRFRFLVWLFFFKKTDIYCVVVCDDKSHLTSRYATPSGIMITVLLQCIASPFCVNYMDSDTAILSQLRTKHACSLAPSCLASKVTLALN